MLKIYRYTTNQYLEQWYKEDGTHSMVFQPISRYPKIENDIHKDQLEGVAGCIKGPIDITIDGRIFPAWDIRTGMAVENFRIACLSTDYSKELCDRFNADCVLELEIEGLEKRIDVNGKFNNNIYEFKLPILNGEAKEILRFYLGHVNYDDKTTNTSQFTQDELFKKTLFTKCEIYAIENEFRIVVEIPQSLLDMCKTRNSEEMYSRIPLEYLSVKQWKLLPKL